MTALPAFIEAGKAKAASQNASMLAQAARKAQGALQWDCSSCTPLPWYCARSGVGRGRSVQFTPFFCTRLLDTIRPTRSPAVTRIRTFINLTVMRRDSIGLLRSARWAAGLVWRS